MLGLLAGTTSALALLASCRTRRTGERLVFPDPEPRPAMPASDGYGIVGRAVADQMPTRFLGPRVALRGPGAARATLVRWWTDHCPFCVGSLPAIEGWRVRYASRGFATLGVYHPKPPHAVRDADVAAAAQAIGYHGPVAVDEDWAALHRVWLDTGQRAATSVSLLLDRDGVVRFVHPGPEMYPTADPSHERADRGYREMTLAIESMLAS